MNTLNELKIVELDASDLDTIMSWYLASGITLAQLADALNQRLRAKAARIMSRN